MSVSAKLREQLYNNFRVEAAEHIQAMTDNLLALEQLARDTATVEGKQQPDGSVGSPRRLAEGQHQARLKNIFRAAHNLKGAASVIGVSSVERLAHALEDTLSAVRPCPEQDRKEGTIGLSPAFFNACYQALDAIQASQAAHESGEVELPKQALKALSDLEALQHLTSTPESLDHVPTGQQEPHDKPQTVDLPSPASISQPQPVDQSRHATPLPTGPQAPIQPFDSAQDRPPISNPSTLLRAGLQIPTLDETIRISVNKLDALMVCLDELLIAKIRAEQRLAQVFQAQEFVTQWQEEWWSARSAYNRLARQAQDTNGKPATRKRKEKELACLLDYTYANQEHLREINELMESLSRQYANDTTHLSLAIDELEQEIKHARMLPFSTITGAFGRMVRDLGQTIGKEVKLEISGGEVEMDKHLLEGIKDPLTHLLRNAIDHGIESADRRAALGKPRVGTVRLTAEQRGSEVIICISDDGAGLDLEAIRQKAATLRDGIDTRALSKTDLAELIFDTGFSTSPIVTDVSGRGVGLDVVRRNVEALRGNVSVDWTTGASTTFRLTLPLTLAGSHGLLVRASDQLFAIPLNFVERILHISPEQVILLAGHEALRIDDCPVALVRLNDILELPRSDQVKGDSSMLVVILAVGERRMAFVVDELAGEQEVVIKGLGKQLVRVGGIAGATMMGNGEVILVLEANDLLRLAQRSDFRSRISDPAATLPRDGGSRRTGLGSAIGDPQSEIQNPKSGGRILVVDDSITTRTLEKNILEAAGYTVQLATDGQEALGLLGDTIAGGLPDLIVADVNMPRLNGFELTHRVKNEARTASLPVILVTSLDSPEDKARGIEVGADAYIVKSAFNQDILLKTIHQLI